LIKRHPLVADSIVERKKYGYINDDYKVILPFEYDLILPVEKKKYDPQFCQQGKISSCNKPTTLFICKKDKKYGIYDRENEKWLIPLKYDFIHEFVVNYSNEDYSHKDNAYENDVRFLALKDGKWRWIDENDKQLSPDLYDYAGDFQSYACFAIKENKLIIFDYEYFPQIKPFELSQKNRSNDEELIKYEDFVKGDLLVNQKGLLVIPPQYSIVSKFGKNAVVKDEKGNQLLIDIDGNKRPFLQNLKVHLAQIDEGVVIVEDTLKKTFGVVTPDGKTILPTNFYAVSALDSSNVIWAKVKRPIYNIKREENKGKTKSRYEIYKEDGGYYLNSVDSGWTMYNKNGTILSKVSFAFPFKINYNHGIGILRSSDDGKEYKAGIWRTTDGTNLLPPQYDHIFFDEFNRLYLIYKKDELGLKVGVCDTNGHILLEPKFERMGVFNGNYALVQEGGKLGLIMRNGEYKVPPQYNAFKKTSENIESLLCTFSDSINKSVEENLNLFYQPYGFSRVLFIDDGEYIDGVKINHFDSIDNGRSRILKNLIIEKASEGEFIDGEFVRLERSSIEIFYKDVFQKNDYWSNLGLNSTAYQLSQIYSNPKSIGFFLGEADIRAPRTCGNVSYHYKAYNFLQNEKGVWDEVHIDDLLILNPDNVFKINQLIIDKIKDLKDANIDCSNSASYFDQTKEKWRIFPEGLRFYLSRSWYYYGYSEGVEVLLTWDELKPYLKKKD
jgi:hypothetical protein